MKNFNHLNVPDSWRHYWTRYPEGYTILEALFSWVAQVDSMVDNQNELNRKVSEYEEDLSEFIERFDPRLQEEVTKILSEWQESGFLEVVISEALQTQMDNIEYDMDGRGVNVLLHGITGDGVTDDTAALQQVINENQVVIIPTPPNYYRITDTITIPSYRKIIFQGNGHWNPNTPLNIRFSYEGEYNRDKAMFLASSAEPGVEPMVDRSHVRLIGNVLLDGNNSIGYGFYGAFLTNESYIGNISVTRTLVSAIEIDKSWYAEYGSLTARDNLGRGVVVGKNFWGGINGCRIGNIRAWGNGRDGTFSESNYTRACGVAVSLGYGTTIENIVSEHNFGAGLVYEHGLTSSTQIQNLYLEANGKSAREEGLTAYNWGLIVNSHRGGGKASVIENIYLSVGTESAQSVWLTGEKPINNLILSNVSGGTGGVFVAEWDKYELLNTTMGTKITGHLPSRTTDVINSGYTTLYVRNTGNDDNDGRTAGTAYATIEKAISKAKEVYTINEINITALTVVSATLDMKGIDRVFTLTGNEGTKIGSTSTSSGLTVLNASHTIYINNVGKINRLRYTDINTIVLDGVRLGHEDGGFSGTIEGTNGVAVIKNGSLDGSNVTNETKNGIRLYNSKLTLVDSPVVNYGASTLSLSEGSTLMSDVFTPSFHDTSFIDGTGMVLAGNRLIFAGGYIYNGSTT